MDLGVRAKLLNGLECPPELSLMLSCLQVSPDPEEIAALSHEVTDWDAFVSWWLRRHRTLPLVYGCLSRYAWTEVPAGVRAQLRQRFEGNVRRNMSNAAALVQTGRLLSDENVSCLAFKGPTLALRGYGNLNRRHAGDIDVLVDPSQIERAEAVLQAAGYRLIEPDFQMSPRQRKVYESIFHHVVYRAPDGETEVELHWRLIANRFLLPVSFDELWKRSRRQTIGGHAVRTLSDADTGLHLLSHGAYCAWFRLFWLCDIAAFMTKPERDWTEMLDHASEGGLSRPALQGALLAHQLLRCPVPDSVLERALRDSKVNRLSRLVVERLVKRYDPYRPTVREWLCDSLFYLPLLRRDLAYKKKSMLTMMSLRWKDWGAISLPDWLFPLYYLLRVPLWCLRRVRNG